MLLLHENNFTDCLSAAQQNQSQGETEEIHSERGWGNVALQEPPVEDYFQHSRLVWACIKLCDTLVTF